jgi:hypothetical protein
MLFDLRGKRKRMIQVIYAGLAVLMGGGLVFFGIGGAGGGGLADLINQNGGAGSAQFDDQAKRLEAKLKQDPKNEQLLVALTRAWYTAGNSQIEYDPATGAPVGFPQSAIDDFGKSAAAWRRYLAQKPPKPSPSVAGLAATALFYTAAGSTAAGEFTTNIDGAVDAQKIYAATRPSLNGYITLARYSYYAGDFAAGDAAIAKAKQEVPKSQASLVERTAKQYRNDGKQIAKQVKAASKFQAGGGGKQALENPLGGLSGGGSGAGATAP